MDIVGQRETPSELELCTKIPTTFRSPPKIETWFYKFFLGSVLWINQFLRFQDGYPMQNCVEKTRGAWWHRDCRTNVNGLNYNVAKSAANAPGTGIHWFPFTNANGIDVLKSVQMAVRPHFREKTM